MSWASGLVKSWDRADAIKLTPLKSVALDFLEAYTERLLVLRGQDYKDNEKPVGDNSYDEKSYQTLAANIDTDSTGALFTLDRLIVEEFGGVNRPPDAEIIDGAGNGFVNYLDNDGDWDKSTTAPPIWTRNTILAAIEQTDYIRLNEVLTPISSGWAYQCYKILNLMRWTRDKVDTLNNPGLDPVVYKESTGVDTATARANWPATWSEATQLTEGATSFSSISGTTGDVTLVRNYPAELSYDVKTDTIKHTADLYFYMTAPVRTASNSFWHPQGADLVENRYAKTATYENQSGAQTIDFRPMFSESFPPFVGPTIDAYGWETDCRRFQPPNYAVSKWDVAGGLIYIDN